MHDHRPEFSAGSRLICSRGEPLDVLIELEASWVTASRAAPLPGYVCIVSKLHVVEPYQLQGTARRAWWDEVSMVAQAIRQATTSTKLNYEIHGNTLPHLHLQPIPAFSGRSVRGTSNRATLRSDVRARAGVSRAIA
jgi:diadenosine tetraphosphate (Ap4A) HIT family hydrolase